MRMAARIVVGLVGVGALLLAARLWMDPVAAAARLGLAGQGALGLASLRADVGGFFAAAGLLSLAGAIRGEARLLTAPLAMVSLALAGRLLTAATGAYDAQALPAMVVEAMLAVLLGFGRRLLAAKG